jgi:hypothetical protein
MRARRCVYTVRQGADHRRDSLTRQDGVHYLLELLLRGSPTSTTRSDSPPAQAGEPMHGVIAPAALTAVTHLCAIATVAAASGTKPPNFLILFGDDWYARNPCRNAYSNILRILQWITWLIAQGLRGHGRKLGG